MQPFHDTYVASGGDVNELAWLAQSFGYANPGPIVAYPPNSHTFPHSDIRTPTVLPLGALVHVPWHPERLSREELMFTRLGEQYRAHRQRLLFQQTLNRADIDSSLAMIDAIATIAEMGLMVSATATHFQAAFRQSLEQSLKGNRTALQRLAASFAMRPPRLIGPRRAARRRARDLRNWFFSNRLAGAATTVEMALPSPDVYKQDYKFHLRHLTGIVTPSYWASFIAAKISGDDDTWLYGPAAVEYKSKWEIERFFAADIARLDARALAAREQLRQHFYDVRI